MEISSNAKEIFDGVFIAIAYETNLLYSLNWKNYQTQNELKKIAESTAQYCSLLLDNLP